MCVKVAAVVPTAKNFTYIGKTTRKRSACADAKFGCDLQMQDWGDVNRESGERMKLVGFTFGPTSSSGYHVTRSGRTTDQKYGYCSTCTSLELEETTYSNCTPAT